MSPKPGKQKATVEDAGLTREGEEADALACLIHGDQRSGLQLSRKLTQRFDDKRAEMGRCDVAGANLENAGFASLSVGQDGAEVQVVGEDNPSFVTGKSHDLAVGGARIIESAPVNGLPASRLQRLGPQGTEIHVHQHFHEPAMATSCSSTLQAA